jgi:hypothetical protein
MDAPSRAVAATAESGHLDRALGAAWDLERCSTPPYAGGAYGVAPSRMVLCHAGKPTGHRPLGVIGTTPAWLTSNVARLRAAPCHPAQRHSHDRGWAEKPNGWPFQPG